MVKLSSEQWNIINEAIYAMNAEGNLRQMRAGLLAALDTLIPFERAFFDLGSRQGSKTEFFDPVARRMERKFLDLYYDEFQYIDTMFWFFSQTRTDIYRESDFVSEVMRDTSAFHSGWLVPQGIYFSMGSMAVHEGRLYGSVNLWRSRQHGDFSDEEVQIMTVLNRHLGLRLANCFPQGVRRRDAEAGTHALADRYHLTPREIEIADRIQEGQTIREIAESLFVTESTVKKHTTHIFRKMKVASRTQLVRAVHTYMDNRMSGTGD
ncbi:MAG: helix-turn-helix transcriptional regulator [Clostridiales Family XIII bacterium]|jgi:DNA-binding CsgD family transcriptional regulator|nr:helix-turn-helix transcriptional regulator [Clostridiales Family XIII bacterium]